jgi:hypothetical protein
VSDKLQIPKLKSQTNDKGQTEKLEQQGTASPGVRLTFAVWCLPFVWDL